jgi:hypothetical protein
MRVRAAGVRGVGRVGRGRLIGRCRLRNDLSGNMDRLRAPRPVAFVGGLRRGFTMGRSPGRKGGDASRVDPREVQSQDAGHAAAEHGSEADFRADGTRWGAGASRRAEPERGHRRRGNRDDRGDASRRPPIDAPHPDPVRAGKAVIVVVGKRRRLERTLNFRRLFAPEVRCAWRRARAATWWVGHLPNGGAWTERHELVSGPEPVPGKAHDFAPRWSFTFSCLGLPTFAHPNAPFPATLWATTAMPSQPRGIITLI